MIKVGISTQQGNTADMVIVAFDGNTGVHHPAFNKDYNDDYNHE